MAEEHLRLFIAIELPDDVRQRLGELEEQLKSRGQAPARWVNPASIHLTLNFLGDVAAGKVPQITEAMAEAAREASPFSLDVRGAGVFPNIKRARVAWVGLEGDLDSLLRIQKNLEANLEIIGFTPEARDFTPHLTLARVNDYAKPDERQKFGELVAATQFDGGIVPVDAVSLMRSQLARTGAVYSRLRHVPLGQ